MHRKKTNIILSLLFIIFSFFYSSKIINYFKSNDPIMIQLKEIEHEYNDTKIEGIINGNDIIPGISGNKIDIDKSYSNMKKTGKFDKNLLVFKESVPDNKIELNNFIISLNKSKKNISIIFELNDISYINEIISIINNNDVNVSFFISKDIFDNSIDIVKKIVDSGNEIELLSNNYSVYEVNKYNSLLKLISKDGLLFCLNKNKDEKLLESCKTSKLYTITPSLSFDNNSYLNIKNNLENGSIILLQNNKNTVEQLSLLLNYIKQKGKKIVLIKNIIN